MDILADECVEQGIVDALRASGHDVLYIVEMPASRSSPDLPILAHAIAEHRLLLTADRDFGDYIYRDQKPSPTEGVVLYRLPNAMPDLQKAMIVNEAFASTSPQQFRDNFAVVDERHLRFRTLPPAQPQQP